MFLYEKVAADAKDASSKKAVPVLAGPQQRRLDELEEDLPLQTIVMFRAMARREVRSRHCLVLFAFDFLVGSSLWDFVVA